MAGSQTAADFQPLTQRERSDLYLRGLTNPWGFASVMSAGLDQWHDKSREWAKHGVRTGSGAQEAWKEPKPERLMTKLNHGTNFL